MSPKAQRILEIARHVRLPLHDEKAAQAALSDYLTAQGIAHEREVRLGESVLVHSTVIHAPGAPAKVKRSSARKQDIVDFMVGGTAIEMKLKGSRSDFYRQLERYAQHERVHELILLTARSIILPPEIDGKPVFALSMSAAFL